MEDNKCKTIKGKWREIYKLFWSKQDNIREFTERKTKKRIIFGKNAIR